jgi:hypothetical protein
MNNSLNKNLNGEIEKRLPSEWFSKNIQSDPKYFSFLEEIKDELVNLWDKKNLEKSENFQELIWKFSENDKEILNYLFISDELKVYNAQFINNILLERSDVSLDLSKWVIWVLQNEFYLNFSVIWKLLWIDDIDKDNFNTVNLDDLLSWDAVSDLKTFQENIYNITKCFWEGIIKINNSNRDLSSKNNYLELKSKSENLEYWENISIKNDVISWLKDDLNNNPYNLYKNEVLTLAFNLKNSNTENKILNNTLLEKFNEIDHLNQQMESLDQLRLDEISYSEKLREFWISEVEDLKGRIRFLEKEISGLSDSEKSNKSVISQQEVGIRILKENWEKIFEENKNLYTDKNKLWKEIVKLKNNLDKLRYSRALIKSKNEELQEKLLIAEWKTWTFQAIARKLLWTVKRLKNEIESNSKLLEEKDLTIWKKNVQISSLEKNIEEIKESLNQKWNELLNLRVHENELKKSFVVSEWERISSGLELEFKWNELLNKGVDSFILEGENYDLSSSLENEKEVLLRYQAALKMFIDRENKRSERYKKISEKAQEKINEVDNFF